MSENLKIKVNSSKVKYNDDFIVAEYDYSNTRVEKTENGYQVSFAFFFASFLFYQRDQFDF